MTQGEREDRLEKMLRHWGEVVAYREAGGVGYPQGGDGGAGSSGFGQVTLDYLSIEEAMMHLKRQDRAAVRNRLEAEYVAKAEGRPWTVSGWVKKAGAGMDRLAARRWCGAAHLLMVRWRERILKEWF